MSRALLHNSDKSPVARTLHRARQFRFRCLSTAASISVSPLSWSRFTVAIALLTSFIIDIFSEFSFSSLAI